MGGTRWCPKCGDEFRPDVTACPDCDVPVVEERPPTAEHRPEDTADHEQLEYDFADWPQLWRDALKLLLGGSGIAHFWDSPTTLVIPRQRQANVEGLIEQVEIADAPRSSDDDDDVGIADSLAVPRYQRDTTTPWTAFRTELGVSARAWRAAPGLPLTTGCLLVVQHAIAATADSRGWFVLLALVVYLAVAGFSGTERVWYLRAFHHQRLVPSELGPLTYAFVGRFACLGILVGLVGLSVELPLGIAAGGTGFVVGSVLWWLIADFALTFVTPALAYTTRSARKSVRIGRRMIVETWPTSKWYVLTPGLAFTALVWARPGGTAGTWITAGLGVFGGLLALWFKGAIAAYYIRRHPETSYHGAAYDDADDFWRGTTDSRPERG